MGKIYIGDLFSKKVTKRRPIWAKSLLWRQSILKGDPSGNTVVLKYISKCVALIARFANTLLIDVILWIFYLKSHLVSEN